VSSIGVRKHYYGHRRDGTGLSDELLQQRTLASTEVGLCDYVMMRIVVMIMRRRRCMMMMMRRRRTVMKVLQMMMMMVMMITYLLPMHYISI
jgi:hypothetical protein